MRIKKSIFRIFIYMILLVVVDYALHLTWLKDTKEPGFQVEGAASPAVRINAKAAILMSYQNGKIYYSKNADIALNPASMSKMMVEYLVLQAIGHHKLSWGTQVQISDYAYFISSHPGFASVPLKKGASYSVEELYDAMAIHSANGATIALAEKISGSEKQFVKRMNETAKQMELTHTHFVNSTGLNNEDLGKYYSTGSQTDENIMSARDLAHLARQLIATYPEVLATSKQAVAVLNGSQGSTFKYYNTDWMLPQRGIGDVSYVGVDGLKTGYTQEAGYCFTGTAKRSNVRLISVVMGTKSKKARFEETIKLFNYGFQRLSD